MEVGQSRYFPGLNSLRFIAALAVVLGHIELYKFRAGMPSEFFHLWARSLPLEGVLFFFVLSGFLITYLLTDEIVTRGDIDVPAFYMRRALRILPLYLLITGISFFLIPALSWSHAGIDELVRLDFPVLRLPAVRALYFLMAPNIVLQYFPPLLLCGPLWSIGVEEQFYWIWPWLMRRFLKWGLWFILGTIVLKIAIVRGLDFIPPQHTVLIFFRDWWGGMRWEALAVGGAGGYLARVRPSDLQRLASPAGAWLALPLLAFLLAVGLILPAGGPTLISLLYLGVLVNIYHAQGPLWHWFHQGPLDYLGRISYGIYLYHSFAIVGTLKILQHYHLLGTDVAVFILYIGTLVITLIVASFSYRYFEMPFLEWKRRFSPRPVSRPS